jgi:ankyrin repeat protein
MKKNLWFSALFCELLVTYSLLQSMKNPYFADSKKSISEKLITHPKKKQVEKKHIKQKTQPDNVLSSPTSKNTFIQDWEAIKNAIERNDTSVIKPLRKKHIKHTDEKGNTLLHIAVNSKNKPYTEYLLKHGAKNIPNKGGLTPFHKAIFKLHNSTEAAFTIYEELAILFIQNNIKIKKEWAKDLSIWLSAGVIQKLYRLYHHYDKSLVPTSAEICYLCEEFKEGFPALTFTCPHLSTPPALSETTPSNQRAFKRLLLQSSSTRYMKIP